MGVENVHLEIAVDASARWTVNGIPSPGVYGCLDVDLSFTPATNLLAIRRTSLAIGARADVRAAWLRFPELALEPLYQRYERLAESRYGTSAGAARSRPCSKPRRGCRDAVSRALATRIRGVTPHRGTDGRAGEGSMPEIRVTV